MCPENSLLIKKDVDRTLRRAYDWAMSKTDEEQLRSALSFAQADLEGWRDGDLLNAVEDLEGRPRFREPGRIKEQLVSIQKGLRGLLKQVQDVRESLATA